MKLAIAFPTNNGNHRYVDGTEKGTESFDTAIHFDSIEECYEYIAVHNTTDESWIEDEDGHVLN
jgi:hypothetical protein